MIFQVNTSKRAETELWKIADYISEVLHSPQAAYDLMYEISKQIRTLNHMPNRFALVSDEQLAKRGVRSDPVKNYRIFYVADETTETVTIISIMYNRRDWANLL